MPHELLLRELAGLHRSQSQVFPGLRHDENRASREQGGAEEEWTRAPSRVPAQRCPVEATVNTS